MMMETPVRPKRWMTRNHSIGAKTKNPPARLTIANQHPGIGFASMSRRTRLRGSISSFRAIVRPLPIYVRC